MNNEAASNLTDDNGDNRAVHMFLAMYGNENDVSIERMRTHLENYGFIDCLPEWVANEKGTLTLNRAQEWLRHLFDLEKARSPLPKVGA